MKLLQRAVLAILLLSYSGWSIAAEVHHTLRIAIFDNPQIEAATSQLGTCAK